jgi:glycosyltransferase involved in cell wall biosynthesis
LGERGEATGRRRLCTIAARNYLSSVELLVETFTRHHPEIPVSVLVVDGLADETWSHLPFEVVLPDALALSSDDFHEMATCYDVTELSTALKPFLLDALLADGHEVVMYLDPDVEVFAPLDDLFDLAAASGIALTPHVLSPVPRDGMTFAEESLLLSGQFNLGFIAVSTGAGPFLDYWRERTRWHALNQVADGYFTDQRWADAVPVLFEHAVVRDPGCNVAYWNLHERMLEHADGEWRAGDAPLRFFHFSGYRADKPFELSAHLGDRPRVRLHEHAPLRAMLAGRADRLRGDRSDSGPVPYRFDRTRDGFRLDALTRRTYWAAAVRAVSLAEEPPPHAFDASGGRRFREWLLEASPERPRLSRHLLATWSARLDLQQAFPALDAAGCDALRHWATVDEGYLASSPAPLAARVHDRRLPGANLVGYLRGEFGIGAAGRIIGSMIRASGIPMATSVVRPDVHRHTAEFVETLDGTPFEVSVLAMNADALLAFADTPEYAALAGTRKVGVWFWEVGVFPEHLHRAFDLVDEVWCATEYVRDALVPVATKPVLVHPLAFARPVDTALVRRDLGLPDGTFLVGTVFDFASVVKRKNPRGAIEAFRRAFAPDDGACLVVKSLNSGVAPAAAAALRAAADDRPDVLFLDGHLDELEMAALYQHLDVYVSLHRSEGLGVPLAAAMSSGVPVVATGWSGNRTFMDEASAGLVPYELVDVGDDAPPYPPEARWAEPDVDAAASLLRELFDDDDRRRAVGEAGRAAVAAHADRRRAGDWFAARFAALTGAGV